MSWSIPSSHDFLLSSRHWSLLVGLLVWLLFHKISSYWASNNLSGMFGLGDEHGWTNYPAFHCLSYTQFIREEKIQSLIQQDCHDKNYAPKHQFRRALCMEVFHAPSSAGRCHWNWLGSAPGRGGRGWLWLVTSTYLGGWVPSQDGSYPDTWWITGSTDMEHVFGGF